MNHTRRSMTANTGRSNTTYSQQTAHQLLLISVVEININLYTLLFVFKKCTTSIHKTNIFFIMSISNDYIVYIKNIVNWTPYRRMKNFVSAHVF